MKYILMTTLIISFSFAIEVEFHLYSGWNLISMPCSTETGLIGDYFPVVQPSYRFIPGRGYIEIDSFPPPNSGFWYFSLAETVVSVDCECVDVPLDICDPLRPVILNGDTIQGRVNRRDEEGCVTAIELINLYDPDDINCLRGIELYGNTLQSLTIMDSFLPTVDLSPLSACTHLRHLTIFYSMVESLDLSPLSSCTELLELDISDNNLTSIDLTPIWDISTLSIIEIWWNDLDSASCAHICDFIETHPGCYVNTDCECE